jgi:hypothetical protein
MLQTANLGLFITIYYTAPRQKIHLQGASPLGAAAIDFLLLQPLIWTRSPSSISKERAPSSEYNQPGIN